MNNFNNKLAVWVNEHVGTIWCAYLFAIIGIMGVVGAFTGNTQLVLIVGSISGYFLQLVLLPVIMVAGKLQSDKTVSHVKKHLDDHHAKITAHIDRRLSVPGTTEVEP